MDKRLLTLIPLFLAALWLSNPQRALTQDLSPSAFTLGRGFTYQGFLKSADGLPITSTCDLRFSLWDDISAGLQIGSNSTSLGVSVNQGYFSVLVNNGNQFGYEGLNSEIAYHLEVAVKCVGDDNFITLTPRQPVTRSLSTHDHLGQTWSSGAQSGLYITTSLSPALTAQSQETGILGISTSSTLFSVGVRGISYSTSGAGVAGYSYGSEIDSFGVLGETDSINGTGVRGKVTHISGTTYGVYGSSRSSSGTGVYGYTSAPTGITSGIYGVSDSVDGRGVAGYAPTETTIGIPYGVYGEGNLRGVFGVATDTLDVNYGVRGETRSRTGYGVLGWATNSGGFNYGVWGLTSSSDGVGVYGLATATTLAPVGVKGESAPNGYAGYFIGRVHVTGNLTKGGGGFKIDHPLDPANQYLYHSFVESPEMMNVYNGVITLDSSGQAQVQLPAWFEALNMDFRYQLTPMGSFAPLYVAQEIQNNSFLIAGGTPGMRVSWLVTGVRHDPWAETNRQEVEQPKAPEEVGKYLHPELYGLPREQSVHYIALPEMDLVETVLQAAPITTPPSPAQLAPAPETVIQPN